MRMKSIAILLMLLFSQPVIALDQAQTERAAKLAFEEKYGSRYRIVIASRATDDDVALAQELLATAKLTTDQPAMLHDMCETAFVLGMRDVAGYDTALEAMDLIARTLPDKAPAARDKVLAFLRRGMATSKGDERAAAVERLIMVHVQQGDALRAASDFGGAAKQYAQALKVAESEKAGDLEALKAKFDSASEREKLELRIEAANLKLATDPTNAMAAAELFQIYLIERDDPAQATRYLKYGGSDSAKKLLPLVTGEKLESLTSAQCLAIGQWFESLTVDAPMASRTALIAHARTYYDQFLNTPGIDKLEALKVTLAVKRLRDSWMKLNPELAKTLATVSDDGWADMLAEIEPLRYRESGRWRRSDTGLLVSASTDPARFMLPAVVNQGYEFTTKFTRTAGEGPVVFILPAGDQQVRLVLGGWAGKASGLYTLAGETLDATNAIRKNATTVMPGTLINDQEYNVAVKAVPTKSDITFSIDLNGERLIDWTGPTSDLSLESSWSLRETNAFGIGATDATVLFSAAKLRALRGDVMLLPKPSTLAERGRLASADGFTDMLQIWDGVKDVYEGAWIIEQDALLIDQLRKAAHARTRLPIVPDADYTIRTRFTCLDNRKGVGGPAIYLPMKDTAAVLVMGVGQRGNLAGLSNVDGKDASNNDTTTPISALTADSQHTLETRVIFKDETTVRIEADLDGKKLIRWEGLRTSITAPAGWTFGNGTSPGIGMQFAEIRFDTVECRIDAGQALLVRQPLAKATAGANTVAADAGPVDLIKLIDLKKHVVTGTWTIESGKLVASTLGYTESPTVMLPIAPNGNYEFRAKFIRAAGRPVIQIYLPVAGTGVDLTLGASEGRTCTLGAPAGASKDPAHRNILSNSAARLVNGSAYAIKVKVETQGDDTTITVDLEGRTYLSWKGPTASLKPAAAIPGLFSSNSPGFIVTNQVANTVARSGATFSDVELKMLTGSATKMK